MDAEAGEFELPTAVFGDPCPFTGITGGACPMKVGVYVYSALGERLPMCEAHHLYTSWQTKDADGRLRPYDPRVERPGDAAAHLSSKS